MEDRDRKFWPFKPRTALVWFAIILFGLLFLLNLLKHYGQWSINEDSDTAVLTGIVVISLLPVLLAGLDILIERGGTIEYGGIKIDFSQLSQSIASGFSVPPNIGVPGQPINDSSTSEILDSLREATACETIVIDLEDGHAWWETRLLVLLAGAVRLKKPEKVVFVCKEGGNNGSFLGWGYSTKLLPQLLKANPLYARSYHAAQAATRQWDLVEPGIPGVPPPQPPTLARLAAAHPWMAFDANTGLPNQLFTEQLLASDLGEQIEMQEGPKPIGPGRLQEIFHPVLYKGQVDTIWPQDRQITEFFDSKYDHMAITERGKYLALATRVSILNTFVENLVKRVGKAKS